VTKWKEFKERSSTKERSHGLLTVYQFSGREMPPAKIKRSDQFGVHIGMSIFPAYNRTLQAITQVQIRLQFFERNKSGILDSND